MTLWNVFCRAAGLTALFPNSRLFNAESYGGWDRATVSEVDIVTGCFLLIERGCGSGSAASIQRSSCTARRPTCACARRSLGARPAVTPEATIVHYGGASERGAPRRPSACSPPRPS